MYCRLKARLHVQRRHKHKPRVNRGDASTSTSASFFFLRLCLCLCLRRTWKPALSDSVCVREIWPMRPFRPVIMSWRLKTWTVGRSRFLTAACLVRWWEPRSSTRPSLPYLACTRSTRGQSRSTARWAATMRCQLRMLVMVKSRPLWSYQGRAKLFHSQVQKLSTLSQPFREKCISEVRRIGNIIIFHLT